MLQESVPIKTNHLFPLLDEKLLQLLRSLSHDDWNRPTTARLWTVKDIAAHLLDGNIRTLSMARDGYFSSLAGVMASHQNLLAYPNRLNADWIAATKRMSSTVLINMLEITGIQFCAYMASLDPFAPAIFPVAWAGQAVSPN